MVWEKVHVPSEAKARSREGLGLWAPPGVKAGAMESCRGRGVLREGNTTVWFKFSKDRWPLGVRGSPDGNGGPPRRFPGV